MVQAQQHSDTPPGAKPNTDYFTGATRPCITAPHTEQLHQHRGRTSFHNNMLYTCVCLCGNATTAAHPTFTQQQSRDTNRADSMHHIPACASASMLYRCPINSTALILVHTPTHCRHFAWKGAAVANSTVGLPYTRCTQLAQNHRASVRTHCYCQHQTHL
jgi:hypothetical protein